MRGLGDHDDLLALLSAGRPESALAYLKQTYEVDYFRRGVALALGTVAARPKQWLLLGVIRLDDAPQLPLF